MGNEQGEVLFCAKDVAEALGYKNTRDAIFKHVDDDDKTTVAICDGGSNYKTKASFINESGLYSLILGSKLESARRFKHWVTSEVLPAIRKDGGYMVVNKDESDEVIMARALLYADYARRGYAKNRTFEYHTQEGALVTRTYLVWTERGRNFIHRLVRECA